MKNGIILAGGTGSRLFPLTHVVNKHLLGVDGKFIIDYPVDTLRQMGIQNLTVVLGGNHFSQVVDHLKDGSGFGMRCNYVYQGDAKGIAQAIQLCERFVDDEDQFVVILGDNVYDQPIQWDDKNDEGAQIVLWEDVDDLRRFGVASVDKKTQQIVKIEEKPTTLDKKFNQYAITGCYQFDYRYFEYFSRLSPSARGEYEITDIIQQYHDDEYLSPILAPQGAFWSDAGTHESVEHVNKHFYKAKSKKI